MIVPLLTIFLLGALTPVVSADEREIGRFQIGDTESITISSPSPYVGAASGPAVIWTDSLFRSGATFVRVQFTPQSRLDSAGMDRLILRNSTGEIVAEYRGTEFAGEWSPIVAGDTLSFELLSDNPVGGVGVLINAAAFGFEPLVPPSPPVAGGFFSICGSTVPSRIRTADPVGRIVWSDDCSGVFTCSGWLFSPLGHFMTNAHCANSETEVASAEIWFNHMAVTCDRNDRPNPDVFAGGHTFESMNCDLDYSVLIAADRTKGNPAEIYGSFRINNTLPPDGASIWIPQHPAGSRKQIAENCTIIDNQEPGFNGCNDPPTCQGGGFITGTGDLSFDCSIAAGSSGSPVLNTNDQVIAIAHAGNQQRNFGVRMSQIALDFPNMPLSLSVVGAGAVAEDASAGFTAMAVYLIGLDRNVTTRAAWSVDPPTAGAMTSAGVFTPTPVNGDRSVLIQASYFDGTATVRGSLKIVVLDTQVNTPILDVELIPVADVSNLSVGQLFEVDVAVKTDGALLPDVRLLQLDTSLTTGATVDRIVWMLPVLAPGFYGFFSQNAVSSAVYIGLEPEPDSVVEFTSSLRKIARIRLRYLADGRLIVLGAVHPATTDQSVRFLAGFDEVVEFSQQRLNVDGESMPFAGGVPTRIIGSFPPSNSIDAGVPVTSDGATLLGWSRIDLQFDVDPGPIQPGAFLITQRGGSGAPPSVFSIAPSELGLTHRTIVFTAPIRPGAWTKITHTSSGTSTELGFLPADVSADGVSSALDILALIDQLNGVGAARPTWSVDVNRSGAASPTDILAEIDLLNGAGVFDVWNDVRLPN